MATKKKTVKKIVTKKPTQKKAVARGASQKTAASAAGEGKARHPKARVVALHKGKAELAKSLAAALARADEDHGVIETRLKTASNSQLLRLQGAVDHMKSKFGSRDKLIAAVAGNQAKDKHYTDKLEKMSLPALVELAKAAAKRTSANA